MARAKARRNKDGSIDKRSQRSRKLKAYKPKTGARSEIDKMMETLHKAGMGEVDDVVNNPAHYGGADNIYETIKVARAKLAPEEFTGAMKFQVMKYNDRAGKKGSALEDYRKAQYYQNELVNAEAGVVIRGHQ